MFSTFSSDLSPTESATPAHKKTTAATKRAQVAHACDWCRSNRVKCDNDVPCAQCRQRGSRCSNSSKSASSTSLAAANREIQRLKERIKQLQTQRVSQRESEDQNQGRDRSRHQNHDQRQDQNQRRNQIANGDPNPDANQNPEHNEQSGGEVSRELSPSHLNINIPSRLNLPLESNSKWNGENEQETSNSIFYGPLTVHYLAARVEHQLCLLSGRSSLDFSLDQIANPISFLTPVPLFQDVPEFSRSQEENFIYPLWESFHPVYPILSSTDFHLYYENLWAAAAENCPRKSSALVDALLAACIQYGSSFMHPGEVPSSDDESSLGNASIHAGYAHYLRSQSRLMEELESPTLTSVQAWIYCIIYLYHASLFNTACSTIGIAVRVAQSLRLHLRPLAGTLPEQQDLQARIWWTLYSLDLTISMYLDRPTLIRQVEVSCPLPEDQNQPLHLSSKTILQSPAHSDISWISFQIHHLRLATTVRGVHIALKEECSNMMKKSDSFDLYDSPNSLEALAVLIDHETKAIQEWVKKVPQSLTAREQKASEPFSTDRVALNLNSTAPLWLQRQQALLQLHYHDLVLSIYRPFLRLKTRPLTFMPRTENMSLNALNHALAITNLLRSLSETEILRGWPPLFQFQWNAVTCMLAFVVGNPVCPFSPAARKGLQIAIQTLTTMQSYQPAARTAVQIVQNIMGLNEVFAAEYSRGVTPRTSQSPPKKATEQSQVQGQQGSIVSPIDMPFPVPDLHGSSYSAMSFDIFNPSGSGTTFPMAFTSPLIPMPLENTLSQPDSVLAMDLWGFDGQD